MSALLLGTYDLHSPEWYAVRDMRLGGSEIAAVLGLSKWESAFGLWHRKRGEIPDQAENREMRWGTKLESLICDEFAACHPEFQSDRAGTYVAEDRPWQLANPDRILYPESYPDHEAAPVALVEAKTARFDDEWGTEGTDEIPPYYLAQCRWYLDVFDLDVCHVPVLIAGSDYREYVVRQDAADVTLMREKAEAFIVSLRNGQRPPIDGHTETYQTVMRLPEGVTDEEVDLDPELAREFIAAQHAYKAAETEKRRTCALVLDAIGSGKHARFAGERLASRAVKKDGTTHSLKPAKGIAA
jgi:putative phage-type endonuclease